uniref:Fibronectin type-III domain-containing protein n=1 Tax=Nothobranchius furzeri TaxID=105023 RepID=A0A8C6LRX6_NOTFU
IKLSLVIMLLWTLVSAELAPPQNPTMITLNTNYTLVWTWDQGSEESSGLKTRVPKWLTVCKETSQRSCDLTGLNLHYLSIFVLQVRATKSGRHSEWVRIEFCPDKDGKDEGEDGGRSFNTHAAGETNTLPNP